MIRLTMSPLQKGHVTAAAQRSQRTMPERVAPTHHASPRIPFVFEVLCAPGVSAVRFCSEVNDTIRQEIPYDEYRRDWRTRARRRTAHGADAD
ncbi:hypothetical protein [Roseiflexus sp.]